MTIFIILLLLITPVNVIATDYSEFAENIEKWQQQQKQKINNFRQNVLKQRQRANGYHMTLGKLLRIKHAGAMIPRQGCAAHPLGTEGGMEFVSPEAYRRLAEWVIQFRQEINQGFAAQFPGSRFDCITGTGHIVFGYQEFVLQDGHIKRYTQKGPVTYSVFWDKDFANVAVSDGNQHIGFIISNKNPSPQNSFFNDVSLVFAAQTQKEGIYKEENKSQGLLLTKNQLIEILNTYYAQNNQNGDMISFASKLILDAAFRESVFEEVLKKLESPVAQK